MEDEPSVREVLTAILADDPRLELAGQAGDVATAGEAAGRLRPDVALVDVKMPGGGGPAATREIRQRSPYTQVVALSAYEDHAPVLQMLRAGAVGYLVKGVPVEAIVHAIQRARHGYGSLSPEVTGGVVHELAAHLEREQLESERRQLVGDRIRAIVGGSGLDIVFQPIADLGGRRTIGAEALARFPPPPPRPDQWFEEAATVGMRTELEIAALRRSLDHLTELPPDVYLSVNLSPETAVTESCRQALGAAPPDRLVIEVTEHAPVEDYERLGDALRPLRQRGTRLAVDDAGAGFASLSHILRLGPDIIKLDTTLTRDIDRDNARRALASGLIAFASEIGASIVAEGIETREELDALRALGVGYGQGYYLAKPAPLVHGELAPVSI